MTLIDDQKEILGEEVEKTVWTLAGFPAVKVSWVVLDTTAMPQFFDHLHVVFHTLLNSLSLNGITYLVKEINLLRQVILYVTDGLLGLLFRSNEKISRIDLVFFKWSHAVEVDGIHLLNGIYLIIPPCHPEYIVAVGHEDIHGVTSYPEIPSLQVDVITNIKGIN